MERVAPHPLFFAVRFRHTLLSCTFDGYTVAMLRTRLFAFAVACIMVAPQADAQGNRGSSNGVPGNIASIQAIIQAVRAQLTAIVSALPALTTLQGDVAGLTAAVTSLSARIDALSGRVDGLASRMDALDSRLASDLAALDAQIDAANARIDAEVASLNTTLGTVSGDLSNLTSRVVTLEGASGGGAASPIIWSGGCPTAAGATSGSYVKYCAGGVDYNTAASHLDASADGSFTALAGGIYRVNFWSINRGATGSVQVRVNGVAISAGLNTATSSVVHRDQMTDVTWPLAAGDVVEVWVFDGGTIAYGAWASSSAQSRVQIEFVGPLPE